MSVSDESGSFLVLFSQDISSLQGQLVEAKARMDRWKEEVTLVQNETRWMHLWLEYRKENLEGREKERTRGFERTCLLCLEAGADVGKNGK